MKKIFFFLISFLFILTSVQAKIWRVNNAVPADFTTAQAAHDGASIADAIHCEPSPANYLWI